MGNSKAWIKNPDYNKDPQFSESIANSKGHLSQNTVFCFKHIHRGYDIEKLCERRVQNKTVKSFIKKIQKLSQVEISEIMASDKFTIGYELLPISILRVKIPSSVTDDIQNVHVFRFNGKKGRIIGYYDGNIFHILFIDHSLSLYDHGS